MDEEKFTGIEPESVVEEPTAGEVPVEEPEAVSEKPVEVSEEKQPETGAENPPIWTEKKKMTVGIALAVILLLVGFLLGRCSAPTGTNGDSAYDITPEVTTEAGNSPTYVDETTSGIGEEVSSDTEGETDDGESSEEESEDESDDSSEEESGDETEENSTEDEAEVPESTTKKQETASTPAPTQTPSVENPAPTQKPTTPPATTATPVIPPVSTEKGTPFDNHGKLTVSGTNILDKNGNIYQLRGVSTHGIAWFPDYVNKAAFQTMRDEWGINVVRLAMYTAEYNGYCSGGDQVWLKNLIDTGVKAATELGMYVIIDWHILSDSNPNTNKAAALAFFQEIVGKYKGYDNILYEICNEPNGGTNWSTIKSYALEVIPVIRAQDADAIIIVGTPTWSQDVDQAAANPITGYQNIMYTLHFYAATHTDWLRNRMVDAINKGLPIFVTEYGICDASGNGGIDEYQANQWVATMNQYHISSCIWNLSNKGETSALINSSCNKKSGWTASDLSASGKWFVNMMKGSLNGVGSSGSSGGQQQTQPQQTQPQQTQPQQTQPTQPSTEYVPPTTKAPVQASEKNCKVEATNGNSWDGHAQYNIRVSNTGSETITNWKVVLTFSGEVEIESSWSAVFTANGKTITVVPDQDWAKTLATGGSAEVGVIIRFSGDVKLVECKLQ